MQYSDETVFSKASELQKFIALDISEIQRNILPFALNRVTLLKTIKIHQNPSNTITTHHNPSNTIKNHQAPSKPIKTHYVLRDYLRKSTRETFLAVKKSKKAPRRCDRKKSFISTFFQLLVATHSIEEEKRLKWYGVK